MIPLDKYKPLSELGKIVSGSTPDTNNATYWNGDIAWITPADLTDYSDVFFKGELRKITEQGYKSCSTQMVPTGTILYTTRAPIGHIAISSFPLCTNQGFKSLIPNENLDSVYGYYALKYFTPKIISLGRGATFGEVSKELFESVQIPVPPLPEQQRIAATLQKSDRIRKLRRYSLQLSQSFLQSVFIQMFGDPFKNNLKLPLRPFSEIILLNPSLSKKHDIPQMVSFVPMEDIDEFNACISPHDFRKYEEVKKGYTPFEDKDVLFAKITPCMENGKIALASGLLNGIGFGSTEFHVLRVKPGTNPFWLLWFVRRKEFRKVASRSFRGTAGQQRVPESFFEDLKVPFPTYGAQIKFANICETKNKKIKYLQESSRQSELLFQSLLHRAFTGQL